VSGGSQSDYTARLQAIVEQLEKAADGVAGTMPPGSCLRCADVLHVHLDSLLPRLAQVTGRLEAASGASPTHGQASGDLFQKLAAVVARIEAAVTGGNSTSSSVASAAMGPLSASGEEESHPSVVAFDELLTTELRAYLENSKAIGGDVEVGWTRSLRVLCLCSPAFGSGT